MPAKYHIHTHPEPPRNKRIGKYGIVDWREDCSACHNCVKRECAYSVYDNERDELKAASEYVDYLYECKGCLCCVQSCTKGLLSWEMNPAYMEMGDEVWTSDIISSTWFQAETGKIPVSGAGYPGPFRGPGFDSILTDMSEIVRPTRDGIHGREYINTQADIGRKTMALEFTPDGKLAREYPPIVEVPIPLLFNIMPWQDPGATVNQAMLDAAKQLQIFCFTDNPDLCGHEAAIPHIPISGMEVKFADKRLVEWADCPDVMDKITAAKAVNPNLIAIVRLPLGGNAVDRAVELAEGGLDALHVFADWHGVICNTATGERKHLTDGIREIHRAMVAGSIRDEITVIASGGISLAEHVAKSIICGADLVSIDVPLMIALECRVCRSCEQGIQCPIDFKETDHGYAVQRIVNLIGAWHSQLLEMMGAMGIREARRLRGETGRAMFFDDLERECFGPIFGNRKAEKS